jgi:hypothetical protein
MGMVDHNLLNGLQGGSGTHEFYHLSAALYAGLTDSAAFYIHSTNHRVGMGTTSPNVKLDVQAAGINSMFGSSGTGIGFIYFSGNQINSAYNLNSNAELAINYTGYGTGITQYRDLNVYDGKQNSILFVDGSTGNVGIGNTSPSQKVTIGDGTLSGNQYLRIFSSASDIYIGQSVGGLFGLAANSAGNIVLDLTYNFPLTLGTIAEQPLIFGTGNVERMRINAAGNVGIGQINPATYKLEVTGTGYFSSNLFTGANVGTTSFASGFAGSGWQLTYGGSDATLTVDNLVVRKAFTAYELDINKINSINGGIVVSVANGTSLTHSGTTIYFDEDGTNKQIQFQVNDYIRAQVWTGRGIASYVGLVTAVNHSTTYGAANIVATTVSGTPYDNMDLVQIGNTTDANRQNLIYITASDTNNPYIDMLVGVDSGSFAGKQRLRIGNLTGITDIAFGGGLSGYGLYADNVYLRGKLVITDGVGVNLFHPEFWILGSSGDQAYFPEYDTLATNSIELGVGAKGGNVALWKTTSTKTVGNNSNGGWSAYPGIVHDNACYRYTVFVKQTGSLAGIVTFGLVGSGATGISGFSPTSFTSGSLPVLNRWYLLVGFIFPHVYAGTVSIGGIYDAVTGVLMDICDDFKWDSGTTEAPVRLTMFNGASGDTMLSYLPRLDIVNGSEPTVQSMLGLYSVANPPSGTGLFVDSTHMGYYDSGTWKTYIDNTGNFALGDYLTGNGLFWDQATGELNITGSISANSGTIGGWSIGADYLEAVAGSVKNMVLSAANASITFTSDYFSGSIVIDDDVDAGHPAIKTSDINSFTFISTDIFALIMQGENTYIKMRMQVGSSYGVNRIEFLDSSHNGATGNYGCDNIYLDSNTGATFHIDVGRNQSGVSFSIVGLPTSSTGLPSGSIWKNGTVLNIV